MTDAQLIDEVLAGNQQQFTILVNRYIPLVRSVCMSQVYSPSIQDDLAQDAFSSLIESFACYVIEADLAPGWRRSPGTSAGRGFAVRSDMHRHSTSFRLKHPPSSPIRSAKSRGANYVSGYATQLRTYRGKRVRPGFSVMSKG